MAHPNPNPTFSFPVKDSMFRVSSWTTFTRGQSCVEVAMTSQGIAVRDTKDTSKTTLFFRRDEWDAFIKGVKAGEGVPPNFSCENKSKKILSDTRRRRTLQS